MSSDAHSEGESLSEGEKKRFGRRGYPQNGDIGGSVAGREHSEDPLDTSQKFRYTRQETVLVSHPWQLVSRVRIPQLTSLTFPVYPLTPLLGPDRRGSE